MVHKKIITNGSYQESPGSFQQNNRVFQLRFNIKHGQVFSNLKAINCKLICKRVMYFSSAVTLTENQKGRAVAKGTISKYATKQLLHYM